jgi:uncharacterized protein YpmB
LRKKNVIIVVIIFIIIIGGYYVYNDMFPVAKPIQHPSIKDITSINISTDNNSNETRILGTDFAKLVIHISNSKPTRIMSVNDVPSVRPYYKIELLTEENVFNYYVYKDDNKVYIERPYEGVYIIDGEVLGIISE